MPAGRSADRSAVDRLAAGRLARCLMLAGLAGLAAATGLPRHVAAGPLVEPSAQRQGELLHLLRHDCGSCHGLTLKGGLGPSLLPERLAGLATDGLVGIVLDGVPGRPMPPWRGLLPENEVVWLVGRLQEGIGDAP